jgi:hypothetical protein
MKSLIECTLCGRVQQSVEMEHARPSVVDRGFKPWSDQTKDYKIDICCFSAKHVAIRCKSKDWLDQNQDNVSDVDM